MPATRSHSPGRSPLATNDPSTNSSGSSAFLQMVAIVMNVFSPLHADDDDEPMETESNGVPRSITVRPHQPSKLDHFIAPSDIEELVAEELEKSPSRRRASGRLSDPAIVAPIFVLPGDEEIEQAVFKQPLPVSDISDIKATASAKILPVAPITINHTASHEASTPVQLGRCRTIDIPSSLEKFKSLKIGLDSLHQSSQSSGMASPAKNPFSPNPIPTGLSEPPITSKQSNEYLKSLIEESLGDFKSALRNDIQNLHVELIKQSLSQQSAFGQMMEEYVPAVKDLMEEIRRLREENDLLRLRLEL